jgi:hypothetical protein
MKAECVRLLGNDGEPQDQSCWLTIGKRYEVLEILFFRDRGWLLRLIGDVPNGVALFQLEMFEIVDPRIPPNWIATWGDKGTFCLSPRPWTDTGFWERYYDRDPKAIKIFEEERMRTRQG